MPKAAEKLEELKNIQNILGRIEECSQQLSERIKEFRERLSEAANDLLPSLLEELDKAELDQMEKDIDSYLQKMKERAGIEQ